MTIRRWRASLVAAAVAVACLPAACAKAPEPSPLSNPSGTPKSAAFEGYTVVWLRGTPYEMGQQQGKLLHDALADGVQDLHGNLLLATMSALAQANGLIDLAQKNSFPDYIDECQGMVDAASDVGWTMEECLVLNFGDALTEYIGASLAAGSPQPGCAQIVAAGGATSDGHLYHARIMDWSRIDFIVQHPIVFVRQPTDGIPHAVVGFPGNVSPYQGMNAAGITVGTNQIHSTDVMLSREGRSNVQLAGEVLAHAHTLDEARAMIQQTPHLTHLTMVVSDANSGRGEVYEIAPTTLGIRSMQDDVLYATNHFVAPETHGLDIQPPAAHSTLRFQRLGDLVPPAGSATRYGGLGLESLVSILRDRVNPQTGIESPPDMFDDGQSLATDGALYEVVFDPSRLRFWVAAGGLPTPRQRFVGFSLGELLARKDAIAASPAHVE